MVAGMLPPCPLPSDGVVLLEVNSELRQWAATNPFGLRNPEHLSLSLSLGYLPTVGPDVNKNALVSDLKRIAGDLTTLAHITEKL